MLKTKKILLVVLLVLVETNSTAQDPSDMDDEITQNIIYASSVYASSPQKKSVDSQIVVNNFYRAYKVMNGAFNSGQLVCEKSETSFYLKVATKRKIDAGNANTKTEQTKLLADAELVKNIAPLSSRADCLARFIVEMEYAYKGSVFTMNANKLFENIYSDDLSPKGISMVVKRMSLPVDDWAAGFFAYEEPNMDFLLYATGKDKISIAKEISYSRRISFNKFYNNLFKIIVDNPEFGCTVKESPIAVDCN